MGDEIRIMDEQIFKPAWRSFYKQIFVMIACFALVSVISVKWMPAEYQTWLCFVFAAVVAYIVCSMVYRRSSVMLIAKQDEITLERGLIARQSIQVSTRNIRTIKVNQSVAQRILNVGDIHVTSSGDEYEISVFNMPNPHEIKEAIQANERKR